MQPILEIKNLSHSYDSENINLSDISFSVMSGEFVSILGPSGSGKSTLLRVIAGLERQSSGTIRINGNIVSDHEQHFEPERRNLGLVVQDKSLFPHLNVLENVMFGIKNRSDKNRQLFYITGGYLTKRTNRGWLEFRSILDDNYIITAIHEFVPRLPWVIYKFTQAKAHLLVMKKFEKHLNTMKS